VVKPLFSNNASATLAGSYSSAATALTLTATQGAMFPLPTGGDYFMATIVNNLNVIEIVKVTARTSDTLTVVRGQEGTAARALAAGEKLELRVTAGALEAVRDQAIDATRLASNAVTTVKIADDAVTAAKIADGAIDAAAKIVDGIITSVKLAAGAAIASLGFTPVQQGGGTGQGSNKIYLGFSVDRLRAQVDVTDIGYILTERSDGSVSTVGYRGLPMNDQNANYQFGLTDSGRCVRHGSGVHQYTIPTDATPFVDGTVIQIISKGGTLTIAPASGVTLIWSPSGATGARTLAANGMATIERVDVSEWWITGTGLS
jgi:hypothetical protein